MSKSGSYPSGHTAIGWAWALVLCEIAPEQTEAILARGRAFGESRMVCNVHWQSDVIEGRFMGASVVARLHAEPQFRAWKKLDPGLRRVGVITGPGHEKLISEARKAAQHHGIELIHHTVLTDMEMLYDFKRLTPEIQGLWLLPDDRILSRRVLREIMSYSTRHRQEVVVFHPELLYFTK